MVRLLNDAIRGLTRNQGLVGMARAFHIADALKRCEYQLRGPCDGVVRHVIAGVEVALAAPDATAFRTLECCYEGELDFLEALEKKLRSGGVYYDVGSNVGCVLIPVAKIVGERGQAVGFEPQPANHEQLIKNVALNGLGNVKVFQVALGDGKGETPIYGTGPTATIVPRAAAWHGNLPVAAIPAMRGDDLREERGLPIPKAVKVDVEGAEFEVLTGLEKTLSSPRCELLCLEIHPCLVPAEVSTDMVFSLVRSLGFNRAETRARGSEIHLVAEKVQAQLACGLA
jgi:FkbM family methyltransferase